MRQIGSRMASLVAALILLSIISAGLLLAQRAPPAAAAPPAGAGAGGRGGAPPPPFPSRSLIWSTTRCSAANSLRRRYRGGVAACNG